MRCLLPEKRRAIKTHVSEKCYTSYICISPECRANSKAFMSPSDHNWHLWKNWKPCPFPSDSDSFYSLSCSTKLFFAVSCWGFEKKSGADKKYLQKLLSLSQVDFQKKSLKYLTPLRIGSMVQNTRCQIWRMPEFFNHNFLHDGRGIFGGVLKLLKLEANNLWSMTTRILPRGQRLFCVRKVVIPESDP